MSVALTGPIASSRRRTPAGTPTVLGYDTKGSAVASGFDTGRMYVSSFTLASPGTLQELHGWFKSSSPGGDMRIVCYDDDGGGGLPGTRLAYTAEISLPSSIGDHHLQETGLSVALTAGTYWVGWYCETNMGSGGAYGETTGGTHQGKTSGASNPPPNPFGTPDTSGVRKHSCWAIVLV